MRHTWLVCTTLDVHHHRQQASKCGRATREYRGRHWHRELADWR